MLGIYFSGTGNSEYALKYFLEKFQESVEICSMDQEDITGFIERNNKIVFSYSVQYSNLPKMLKDFIDQNSRLWQGKKIFIIATMGLFSGDGAGILARRMRRYGAQIIGGLHLKMPDSIADVKVLKRPLEKNRELVRKAEKKIECAVSDIKNGKIPQDGMSLLSHLMGLFGQRLYFRGKTKKYSHKIKINLHKCVGCGKCAALCPMKNITIEHKLAKAKGRCTMCYRCINFCPAQAITLLGTKVIQQGTIEKYLQDEKKL